MVLELAEKNPISAVVLCNSIPVQLGANLARELKKLRPDLRHTVDFLVPSIHGIAQPLVKATAMAAGDPEEASEQMWVQVPPEVLRYLPRSINISLMFISK